MPKGTNASSATTLTDSTGAVISYGDRWIADGPPVDSYGVESNLEQFAPLHSVADALIAYLRREYRVTISEADQMERLVMAVAAGRCALSLSTRATWTCYALTAADGSGSESGEGDVTGISEDRLQNGAQRLGSVPNGWQPWPAASTVQ